MKNSRHPISGCWQKTLVAVAVGLAFGPAAYAADLDSARVFDDGNDHPFAQIDINDVSVTSPVDSNQSVSVAVIDGSTVTVPKATIDRTDARGVGILAQYDSGDGGPSAVGADASSLTGNVASVSLTDSSITIDSSALPSNNSNNGPSVGISVDANENSNSNVNTPDVETAAIVDYEGDILVKEGTNNHRGQTTAVEAYSNAESYEPNGQAKATTTVAVDGKLGVEDPYAGEVNGIVASAVAYSSAGGKQRAEALTEVVQDGEMTVEGGGDAVGIDARADAYASSWSPDEAQARATTRVTQNGTLTVSGDDAYSLTGIRASAWGSNGPAGNESAMVEVNVNGALTVAGHSWSPDVVGVEVAGDGSSAHSVVNVADGGAIDVQGGQDNVYDTYGATGVLVNRGYPASSAEVNVADGGKITSAGTGILAYIDGGRLDTNIDGEVTADGRAIAVRGQTGAISQGQIMTPRTRIAVGESGSVSSTGSHAIDLALAIGINTVVLAGDVEADSSAVDDWGNPATAVWGGAGSEDVTVAGGSITGNIHLGEGFDALTWNGGAINGAVYMGYDRDDARIGSGADLSGLTVFDGEGPDQIICAPRQEMPSIVALMAMAPDDGMDPCEIERPARTLQPMLKTAQSPDDGSVTDGDGVNSTYNGQANDPSRRGWNTMVLQNELTGSSVKGDGNDGPGSDGYGAAGNTLIVNWDEIHIGSQGEAGRLNLTGDLNDGRYWEEGASKGQMEIHPLGMLALNEGVSQAQVDYHVANGGTINTIPGNSTLIVNGNYVGHGLPGQRGGSQLLTKSHWDNPDGQVNDHLIITGSASGSTQVRAMGDDGSTPDVIAGNVTPNTDSDDLKDGRWESPVVTVLGGDAGDNNGNTFWGEAETAGAAQAQLANRRLTDDNDGETSEYIWTISAVQPEPEPGPGEPESTPIYTPGTAGYVQMPRINREMGLAQLGSMHNRVGEQQTWAWDNCGQAVACDEYRELGQKKLYPVWGRIGYGNLKEQGKNRFGYDSDTAFLQFGVDTDVRIDKEKNRRHVGAMLTYSRGEHDFYDKYRAKGGIVQSGKYVGKGKTDMVSLGGYGTWYKANGAYLDVVGNLSYLHNKYESGSGNASQSGYGIGVSAEVGKPWAIGQSNWLIEPQAQLMYQYVHLNGFDDATRHISGQNGGALRGRLGARLAYNAGTKELRTNTFYVRADVLHDLTGNKSRADVGTSTVEEHYARTWGELGIGAQLPLGKRTYLFGDINYQRSLGGYSNVVYRGKGVSREGYGGHIGLRHLW